jgi:chromosome segregation ATPase
MSEELFEEIAEKRFYAQAGLERDSAFCADDGRTVESSKEKINELKQELERWTKVRVQALKKGVDQARIGKVSQKINQLQLEIMEHENYIETTSSEYKERKQINDLKSSIEQLEQQRASIDTELAELSRRLRELDPNASDMTNDPSTLHDDDDAFEQLADMITERRRLAIESNDCNGDPNVTSRNVVIKNPK